MLDAQPASATIVDRPGPRPDIGTIGLEVEAHRGELTRHCRRMLGSGFEAEDAVQETMVRAWRRIDGFEGRSTLRTWLYRIATNVCLDMRRWPQRRAQPMDLGPSSFADAVRGLSRPGRPWDQPLPDGRLASAAGDPAEIAASRDTTRLALTAALRHLPPRQRAVLILRDVFGWPSREAAELLGTTVASVNSALQRARATLATVDHRATHPQGADGEQQLLAYLDAFERYDISSLVALVSRAQMPRPPGRYQAKCA